MNKATTKIIFLDRPKWCLDCGERTKASQVNCPECGEILYEGKPVTAHVGGRVTLPNGDEAFAGKGGTYRIGGDTYPVTIIGWSKSGKTIYYRMADSRRGVLFIDNENAPVLAATYRARAGVFKPKGSGCGFVHCAGYERHMDPSF